ncbi:P-loop containing nucleoside triphosphate hydrolase protein [Pelagophyceae sp. CCMP2097]|nr:P-loop containing nucleoside triphosphate hydrolase protein [Pelagophyceae sp. CCMP2097]
MQVCDEVPDCEAGDAGRKGAKGSAAAEEASSAAAKRRPPVELLRYADARDYGTLCVAAVAVVISGANQPAQLIIFGRLLDSFNGADVGEAVKLVHFFASLYAIVAVQQFFTVTAQTVCVTRVAAAQARRIREKYFDALMRLPISWFDSENQGAVAASVLEATLAIQDGLGEKLATGLQGVVAFLLGICVSLYYAWSLTLVSIGALPFIIGLLTVATNRQKRAFDASTDASTAAASVALEALTNVRTVAAFGAERRVHTEFATRAKDAAERSIDLAVANGINGGAVAMVLYGTWALGLWYGSYLIRRDMKLHESCNYRIVGDDVKAPDREKCVTGGEIMTSFLCVLFGGLALLQALPGLAAFQLAQREGRRVFEVIDRARKDAAAHEADCANKMAAAGGAEPAAESDGAIEFDAVAFAYPSRPDRPVYDALTLRVEAGQTVALVGQSGCGKSTAVALLLRFYDVQGGSVRFGGRDVRSMDLVDLRSKIGLVSQEPVLFTGTIRENIGYGLSRAGADQTLSAEDDVKIEKAARMANAFDFVKSFPDGFDTQVGDSGIQLSGGQKQRVAIARALIREPRALILDEATSALDSKSEKVVQAALDQVLETQRRTTLIIAHRLSTIRRADKICVFSGGAVVEEGSHDDLMARGARYYALVEAQLQSAGEAARDAPRREADVAVAVLADDDDDDAPADAKASPPLAAVVVPSNSVAAKPETANKVIIAWLWSHARQDRPWVALGVFGAAVGGLTQPLLGFLMAEFIVAFYNTSTRAMRKESQFWALIFVAMGAAAAIAEVAKGYGLSKVCERVVERVRTETFEAMLRQPVGWHDDGGRGAGALAARLSQDCATVRALVGQRLATSVGMGVIVVGGLTISFMASWELTLVTLTIIPLIVLPIALTATYVQKVAEAANESLRRAGGVASEAVLHVRTVRALGVEQLVSKKFDNFLELPERQAVRKGFAQGLGSGTAAAVVMFGAAFQYYIGGVFFRKGWVSFADLMKVLLVIIFLAFGLGAVSNDAVDKAEALEAAKRIHELITLVSPLDALADESSEEAAADEAAAGPATVEFCAVAFAYPSRPDRTVYSSLNLRIAAGSTVALVGESGCGKSTAVALLLRYYDVTGGSVKVGGVDVRDLAVKRLRAQCGLVSQEPVLFTRSIADNIRYGAPNASRADVEEAARLANAHDFVGDLADGYDTQVGERGIQLSGGQKQRVAIARALVRRPRVLILDEATSALDAQSERVVQAAIDALISQIKCTTLVIAHRLSTVRHADKIAVLARGGVVAEQGTHDDLIKVKGLYHALVMHDDRPAEGQDGKTGPAS